MKKIYAALFIVLISSFASSAVVRKQVKFLNERGEPRTDVTSVTILDVGTTTSSTLTKDEGGTISVTNPMTLTSTNTGLDAGNGIVSFCSEGTTYDMQIVVGGVTMKFFTAKASDVVFQVPLFAAPGYSLAPAPTRYIWVSTTGSDTTAGNGSFDNPYLTIAKALTVVTATRNTIMVMPGTYAEAQLVWPNVNNVTLRGVFGGVTIEQATPSVTPVLSISPNSTATLTATVSDVEIVSDFDEGFGISIANGGLAETKKLIVNLNNVAISNKNVTDTSLVITGTEAVAGAIRVYAKGTYQTWEGLVDFTSTNTGDRLRIYGYRVIGAITMNEAIASELTLINSCVPAPTVHSDTLLTNIGCWKESDADPDIYTLYTDADSD